MVYLKNFMRCSRVEVCGNEEELDRYLNEIKKNPFPDEYIGLKSELKEILDNDKIDHLNFLVNDEYELFFPYDPYTDKDKDPSQIQYEAKKFIVDMIWNKLYPDDKIEI